jgi:ABC-type branched-subunit amino acid transport system ATPase component
VAIVLTEQNAEICMKVSDYCLLLDLGKVVSEGTPEKLMANDDIVRTYFGI